MSAVCCRGAELCGLWGGDAWAPHCREAKCNNPESPLARSPGSRSSGPLGLPLAEMGYNAVRARSMASIDRVVRRRDRRLTTARPARRTHCRSRCPARTPSTSPVCLKARPRPRWPPILGRSAASSSTRRCGPSVGGERRRFGSAGTLGRNSFRQLAHIGLATTPPGSADQARQDLAVPGQGDWHAQGRRNARLRGP